MSAQQQQPPLIDGRYRRIELLGNGSFGEVWRGRDVLQDSEVAIKLVFQHVTLDEVLLEAQLLTRLRQHDRIVTIRNVKVSPPLPYIVTDFIKGGSAEGRLTAGEVSLVEAVRWTRNALAGLEHAHSLGVLHRDIKPGNLLIDIEERAVLADFGIAEDTIRNLLANPSIYSLHAAPELLKGKGSSRQTDIFAVGCTLYRLLTSQYPFASVSTIEQGVEPKAVHRFNPQIPLSLRRVVDKALAPDPLDRYTDARQMSEALGDCRVRNCWLRADDQSAIEVWRARAKEGQYELRVIFRPRAQDYEVTAKLDQGAGPRTVVSARYGSRALAFQARRGLLVRVVEGKRLR